jgi:hypothetical protein
MEAQLIQHQSLRRLSDEQRQALMDRISQRLNDHDDETLALMADLAQGASGVKMSGASDRSLSRRSFLTAALMGGFVAATAGAVAVWEYGAGRGRELGNDLDKTRQELDKARQEIAHLWSLVHLHEKLDNAGLEQVITTGMAAVGAGLGAVALAGETVQAGMRATRDGLIKLDTSLPAIRASITWLEGLVGDLAQRVHLLEDAIGRAVNQVSPITQALGDIFNSILAALPLPVGAKIKEVLDRISDIITLVPRAVADINVKVLTPFRDGWFSDGPKGVNGWLVEPILAKLLDPLEALLKQLGDLARRWEADFSVPAQAAMNKRDTIRQEIADYKTQVRLQEPHNG